ncbi:unnamed protein product [Clavelina lepadiformis]|uniref:Uncharacterized protein n=1 Tax=Clavelina lepadiformis TaxID=159417 RepID=A0ABP0FWX8_CLALP
MTRFRILVRLFRAILLFGFAIKFSRCAGARSWKQAQGSTAYGSIVGSLINSKSYQKYIRPDIENGPVNVNVALSVTSLDKISDSDMVYTITFTLYQSWIDSRLNITKRFANLPLPQVLTMAGSFSDKIWVPDTYIVNSEKSFIHDVTSKNGLIQLDRQGTVTYVLRITSKVSCPMKLRKYPLDKQVCKFRLASWSFTDKDLKYNLNKKDSCDNEEGAVAGMEDLVLQMFTMDRCSVYLSSHSSALGNYSELVLEFKLKRNIFFFGLQTYIPSIFLVILSWVSFWINHTSVPARVCLGVTSMLAMTTLMVGVYSTGPRSISYVKAIDIYVCSCFILVFAALLQYILVHGYSRKAEKLKKTSSKHPITAVGDWEKTILLNANKEKCSANESKIDLHLRLNKKDSSIRKETFGKDMNLEQIKENDNLVEVWFRRAEKFDERCRWVFPLLFVVINVIYWCIYLNMAD